MAPRSVRNVAIVVDSGTEAVVVVAPAGSMSAIEIACATPKSRIFTEPSGISWMFAGLRSRWMMPFACAAVSADAS